MVKKLAEKNHTIWVITNKIQGEPILNSKNIKICHVKPVLKYQGGLPPSIKDNLQYLINASKAGKKIVNEENIDIIHSNNFTPAIAGGVISFLTKTKHVTSIWDIFSLCGSDYWKQWVSQTGVSRINQFIGPIFEKMILKTRCNAFHTISNSSKDDIVRFGGKKPIYIIEPSLEKIEDENLVQNDKQFIFVGRLVFYKNIEILIKAIKIVKKQEGKIKLVILGGGPQLKKIQWMIKNLHLEENIIVKGYVSSEEKIKLISESNVMLFPSLCEGFGLVILEAFSQNKPVIVSNLKPMSEIILHGSTGYVLNPHDEKIWAEHILKLARNPQNSKKMGKNGNQFLKTKYSQDKMYQKIIKMYEDIIRS
jgi:glycosyltransferase involved in cell wall biosynthesis